jgi:LmbE family N-acetylglucosaminyl deacetylase
MVVAPHPDDETLGCGGTILRHVSSGDIVDWVIVSRMVESEKFSKSKIQERAKEIEKVSQLLGVSKVHTLGFPAADLDSVPMGHLIQSFGSLMTHLQPETIYLPYRYDIHTDHRVVFDMVSSCSKWFRYPSVKRILAYETISETEFSLNPDIRGFRPNVFIDIQMYLDKKIEIFKCYQSEVGEFPFPRSEQAIRALATFRGASVGCLAAEAFMLLREIE